MIYPLLANIGWSDLVFVQPNASVKGRADVPDALLFADEASLTIAKKEPEDFRRFQHGLCVVEAKRWARALDREDKLRKDEDGMADTLTPTERSERMSRVKGRDTAPEMLVRRVVHAHGYRYRLHRRELQGCPDLVFGKRRKVIFVHGRFWHRHDDSACKLARPPKSRLDFWLPKLEANRQRDEKIRRDSLRAAGSL